MASFSDWQGNVVKITKEERHGHSSRTVFDSETLKRIFLPYGNYLVAVYAIAGPFRTGKSFLQSLMVSFLLKLQAVQNGENVAFDLGPTSETIQKHFGFRGGQQPFTRGIHILDQPFLLDFTKSGILKKVALFLVDTQGLFDLEAAENDAMTMGTMNFLLSSLQYYNVKERIDKIQLDYIFKESLMFVVRDWENDDEDVDYPHGLEGGKKYFKTTTQPSSRRAREHNLMGRFLSKTFGEIPCYLLPEPGKAVKKKTIKIGELDRDFRRFVLDLFKTITSPKNIVIKKVGGKELTCRELCRHMEASVEKMKGFSGVESYITVSYERRMQNLCSRCARNFIAQISGGDFQRQEPCAIESRLSQIQDDVMKEYERDLKCGDEEFEANWKQELLNLLTEIRGGFVNCAVAETEFISAIKTFCDWVEEKFQRPGGLIFNERFKEEAREKRQHLLGILHRRLAEYLYGSCSEYFREKTNLILAEIDRLYDRFQNRSWLERLLFPAPELVLSIVWAASGLGAPSGVHQITEASSQHQLALQKSPTGQLTVTLCFGQVMIPLHSKINLAS